MTGKGTGVVFLFSGLLLFLQALSPAPSAAQAVGDTRTRCGIKITMSGHVRDTAGYPLDRVYMRLHNDLISCRVDGGGSGSAYPRESDGFWSWEAWFARKDAPAGCPLSCEDDLTAAIRSGVVYTDTTVPQRWSSTVFPIIFTKQGYATFRRQ